MPYEPKTTATDASVDAFLDTITDPQRRSDSEKLIQFMSAATKQPPVMWGKSIVGFGRMKTKYASGHEGEWMIMGFASRKKAISLYLMCDLNEVRPLLRDLGPHERGVGCLYIKSLADVDEKTLKKLIDISFKMAGKSKREPR